MKQIVNEILGGLLCIAAWAAYLLIVLVIFRSNPPVSFLAMVLLMPFCLAATWRLRQNYRKNGHIL